MDYNGRKAVACYPILDGICQLVYNKIKSLSSSFFHTTMYEILFNSAGNFFCRAALLPVESPKGVSLLGSHGTVRESLPLLVTLGFFNSSLFRVDVVTTGQYNRQYD